MTEVPANFLILSLPRSRSAWCAKWLSYSPWVCMHEHARHLRGLEDVRSWFSTPFGGSVETAVAPFWRLIPPGTRVVVVRRERKEVLASLLRVGAGQVLPEADLAKLLFALDAKLDQVVARFPGALEVPVEELGTAAGAKRVWEYALQVPFDRPWWLAHAGSNIQCDFAYQQGFLRAHLPQLARMAGEAKREILWGLRRPRRASRGEISVSPVDFAEFVRGGLELFKEHAKAVKAPVESFNWELAGTLAARGELVIVGAKKNSRLVGYAVGLLGEDLFERRKGISLLGLYATKGHGMLGLRLVRALAQEGKNHGCAALWLPQTRHSTFSWRMPSVARRLRASPVSSTFEVSLS